MYFTSVGNAGGKEGRGSENKVPFVSAVASRRNTHSALRNLRVNQEHH